MTPTDVLNMVRVHRDHVASKAATWEARGDRYGDHDARWLTKTTWMKARSLNAQVRELDALVREIERAIAESSDEA